MPINKNTDDETLDLERDAQGDEGVSERSESEIEGRDAASTRDADDTGDEGEGRENVGFKKRISKLTAQKRKTEEERDALRVRLEAFEAKEREAAARRRAQEEATPAAIKQRERREAIRELMDEAFGEGYSAMQDESRTEKDLQKEQYALNAVSYLRSELEDHGVPMNDETLVRWERAVGSEIQEDPALLRAFRRPSTQQDAITEAVNRVRDGLMNPILKSREAKPLERIERNRSAVLGSGRGKGGGEAETPFPDDYVAKPPKGASQAEQEAFWQNHRDEMWRKLNAQA